MGWSDNLKKRELNQKVIYFKSESFESLRNINVLERPRAIAAVVVRVFEETQKRDKRKAETMPIVQTRFNDSIKL